MTIQMQTKRLTQLEAAIDRRDLKLAELKVAQEQQRAQATSQREALALVVLRQQGLLDLPATQLVDLLSSLGNAPTNAPADAVVAGPTAQQAEQVAAPELVAAPDTIAVAVRLGAHPGNTNRPILENTGFHADRKKQKQPGLQWNGKQQQWRGKVTPLELQLLQARFGDRVLVLADEPATAVAPGTPASGSQPTETEPNAQLQQEPTAAPEGNPVGSAGEAVSAPSMPVAQRPTEAAGGVTPIRPRLPSFGRGLVR